MTDQQRSGNPHTVEPLSNSASLSGEQTPLYSAIEIVAQLAQRKMLIAKVTGLAAVAGAILSFTLPVRYTAVAKIMPPKQTESTISILNSAMGTGSLAAAAGGGLGLKDPNAIFIGLLKSRPVADFIIQKFGLLQEYGARDMTAARKKLDDRTQIVSEKSELVAISFEDSDKKRAAEVANAYVEQLRALTKSIAFTEASRRRLFFEDQLKTTKENLVAAEVAFQQIQQSKGLVHLDAQANVTINRLALLHGQIAAKQVELQALRSYSTEQNPDVQLAERQLSTMQSEAGQIEQQGNPSEFSDIALKDVPKAGLDYLRAQREVQYQQSFFDMLLKQFEAAKLDEAKEATVIQVVEPAIEPDRRSTPRRGLILLLSTMVGFLCGCILAKLQQWLEIEQASASGGGALGDLRRALMGTFRPSVKTARHN